MKTGNPWSSARFRAEEYEELLCELVARGYRSVQLKKVVREEPHMFLRHDVDLSPELALQIARREANIGVQSTFYFLVSTPLYSIASAPIRAILEEIIEAGHEVGLHLDVTRWDPKASDLDAFAGRECDILELCAGKPVETISFHRPAPQLLGRPEPIAGRRHCYEPALFEEVGYISDSNGGWHHGHPLDHPAVQASHAIQLLTHPIWWCNSESISASETVDELYHHRCGELRGALEETVTAYRKSNNIVGAENS
ncbi:hypothetical protein P7228_06545 [Altererythrobacter arenosus]|uniref:Polysaccharide deacetylase family protein n=1 Tax=Altererythrobacter arenosus TaxID=3032592 RepID=A0ABY8FUN6_9SPHN|nr:hypothetical protein [Altererythrobacter sp. CAU 1644]WFL78717.1 hypothetical protein P7228_06545 [Altererythrobacter sp. CAU 1644]